MTARQLQRRDSSADWASSDPTLAAGEIGYDTTLSRFKIGDGSTAWSSLPFSAPLTPNPTSGADNFAPIADPTFTGTVTVPTLAVTTLATMTVDDAANVPLTITADAAQTANLLTIENSAATALVTVDASGNVDLPASDFVVGDDAAGPGAFFDASAGAADFIKTTGTDYVRITPANIGGGSNVLSVVSSSSAVFSVTGNGRVLKTGGQGSASDLLNRDELDARYAQSSAGWIPEDETGNIGSTDVYHANNYTSGTVFNPTGVGTHLFIYWTWTSVSDNELLTGSGVVTGSTFSLAANHARIQVISFRIS